MINLLILKMSLNQPQSVHVSHRQPHLLQPVHLSESLPPVLLQVLFRLLLIFLSASPKTLPQLPTLISGPGIPLGGVPLELHPLPLPRSRGALAALLAPSHTEEGVTDGLQLLVVVEEGLRAVDQAPLEEEGQEGEENLHQ